MSLLDGNPGPFILLALSVALAGYNVIFLYNLARVPKEQRAQKSDDIVKLLEKQVIISLLLMPVLIIRVIFKALAFDGVIPIFDWVALFILLVIFAFMFLTAYTSFYKKYP